MKKWKIWLAVIAIFMSGVLVGALGAQLKIRRAFKDPATMRSRIVSKVSNDLKLDETQRAQLDPIIKDMQEDMKQNIGDMISKAEDRVEKILKPDQLPAFNKLKEDRRKKFPQPTTVTPTSTLTAPVPTESGSATP